MRTLSKARLSNLSDCRARVGPAGSTPCGEFDRIDAAVANLGPVHHRVVHPEFTGEVPLRQAGLGPHSAEHPTHSPIGRFMLCPCCHCSSRLNSGKAAASLAAGWDSWILPMARRRKRPISRQPARGPLSFPFDDQTWTRIASAFGLAPQEARTVERILCGMCDKQIAADLRIGVSTLRTYLRRIFDRLGVEDRVQLVLRVFIESGLSGDGGCRQN